MRLGPTLDRLVDALKHLPGIGPRSAQRIAFHLLQHDRDAAVRLGESLLAAVGSIRHCARCNTLTELEICETCSSPKRDAQLLCVVESPADQLMIEQSLSYTWSPDSKKLVGMRLRRGYHRVIQYVESSPTDQLQPKYRTMEYAKPGDALDIERPVLFIVGTKTRLEIDDALFADPYELTDLAWRNDSRAFTFEYNERGHQVYRIVEVDAATGAARAVVEEKAATFFCYSGKKYRFDLADGREVVWMSERDGWNHLYLYDGAAGTVRNPITKGEWVVRSVDKVDEEKRQVYFQASGVVPGQDPYFLHAFRANLDGTGLVRLTDGDANHTVTFSPDHAYFVDTWSRVDLAPTTEIRRVADKSLVMTVEKGNIDAQIDRLRGKYGKLEDRYYSISDNIQRAEYDRNARSGRRVPGR